MECGGGSNLVRGGSAGLWLACGISTGSTGDMECESSAGSLTQDQLRFIIGDKINLKTRPTIALQIQTSSSFPSVVGFGGLEEVRRLRAFSGEK